MSRWFRLYDELLDDPKVQRLSGEDFKAWVNLLCLASRNEGLLPGTDDIAFALRIDSRKTAALLGRLVAAGLLDASGDRFTPHGWSTRQYKSDVSTDRVKRFRQRSKPVSETPTGTPPETEADTETDSDVPLSNDNGTTDFAFEGKVIRLTPRDLAKWQRAYPDVDVSAHLQSRDDWLSTEADDPTRRKWFVSTSNHLANLQQRATARDREVASAPLC